MSSSSSDTSGEIRSTSGGWESQSNNGEQNGEKGKNQNQNEIEKKLLFNDDPAIEIDELGHWDEVIEAAEIIKNCQPPYVLGIHGDWGSGKTSFLKKLHFYFAPEESGYLSKDELTKINNNESEIILPTPIVHRIRSEKGEIQEKEASIKNGISPEKIHSKHFPFETIWFDAWKYHAETQPAVALLNEIRNHFTLTQKITGQTAKIIHTALMGLSSLTKFIGVSPEKIQQAGEKYEQMHLAQPLPSQLCRDILEKSIDDLFKHKNTFSDKPNPSKLLILVDDLDRCLSSSAFRFLEAMKIYFSIPNCVFVVGMDVRHVRRGVAAELKSSGLIPDEENSDILAADYLNKIFQDVIYLPILRDRYDEFVKKLFRIAWNQLPPKQGDNQSGPTQSEDSEDGGSNTLEKKLAQTICDYQLIPPNPRKAKGFIRFLFYYLKRLKNNATEHPTSIDPELLVIVAYLKYFANDIYRILVSHPDFWKRLWEFSTGRTASEGWGTYETDQQSDIANAEEKDTTTGKDFPSVLKKYRLPNVPIPETATDEASGSGKYESTYWDPGDESVLRIASLIQTRSYIEPSLQNYFLK